MGLFRFRLGSAPTEPSWSTIPTQTVAYGTTTADLSQYLTTDYPVTYATVTEGSGDDAIVWPSYLSLNPSTGVVTPTVAAPVGSVSVKVRVTDSNSLTATTDLFTISIVKGTNRAPTWATIPPITISAGSSINASVYASDLDSDTLTYSPVPPTVLPTGFALSSTTGIVTVDQSVAGGAYSFRLRVTDISGATADSGQFVVTVNAVSQSALNVAFNGYLKQDTTEPEAKYGKWNMAHFDKRGGLVMWANAAHGDNTDGVHSVRYYNDTSSTKFGIAPGQTGYLVEAPPDLSSTTAKVADYDNYPWFYVNSEDKFFWIYDGTINAGNRNGIFDFQVDPPDWTYGNSGINASQWPTGPYWSDYVRPVTTAACEKNKPIAYSESADMAIQTRTTNAAMVWDRNPNYLPPSVTYPAVTTPQSQPWRYRFDGTAYAWKETIADGSIGWLRRSTNSGCAVGNWFYFVRQVSPAQRPAGLDAQFWRVNMLDFAQYERLPDLPEWYTWQAPPNADVHSSLVNVDLEGSGGLMVYDEDSYSIIFIYHKVFVFDIESKVWSDKTPANFERIISIVGDIKRNESTPTTREILYRGGALVSYAENATVVNQAGENGLRRTNFHKLILTGAKKRARFVPAEFDAAIYSPIPSVTGALTGKHRRLIYTKNWATVNTSSTERAVAQPNGVGIEGWVWIVGGDYNGLPWGGSAGDYTNKYPGPAPYSGDSGRKDVWRLKVNEVNSKVQVSLACNQVAYYPYTGSVNLNSYELGPMHPDGCGLVFDKRGVCWVGPGYYRGPMITNPRHMNPQYPDLMYQLRMPEKHTDGVRLGNGWTLPAQNVLMASTTYAPTFDSTVAGTTPSSAPTYVSPTSFRVAGYQRSCFMPGRRFTTVNTAGTITSTVASRTYDSATDTTTVVVTNDSGSLDSGINTIRFNVDDIAVGNAVGNGLFGGSNVWTTYDPKEDVVLFGSKGDVSSFAIYKFPCLDPAPGSKRLWTRTTVNRTGGSAALLAFLNPQIRNIPGTSTTPYNSTTDQPNLWAGSQAVIRDDLYFVVTVGASSSGYANRKLVYIQRVNLRDTTDQEYIALPYSQGISWARGHDGVIDPAWVTDGGGVANSANEFRDMQALGHLLVFGPASDNRSDSDPWCWWYNTNSKTWTIGQTYAQMRQLDGTLPQYPDAAPGNDRFTLKGRSCVVPETGELWTTANTGGIIKYRIL